jgi:hypothetical protein
MMQQMYAYRLHPDEALGMWAVRANYRPVRHFPYAPHLPYKSLIFGNVACFPKQRAHDLLYTVTYFGSCAHVLPHFKTGVVTSYASCFQSTRPLMQSSCRG